MATSWVKSLQCKANALHDVYTPIPNPNPNPNPNPKHHHNNTNHLLSSSSCRKSFRDVVDTTKKKKPRKPTTPSPPNPKATSRYPSKSTKPGNPDSNPNPRVKKPDPFFPTLTELPLQHPSHNVVQIIFHTSWSPVKSFPGRVEIVHKIQNPAATATRFEEYRELVKSRAGRMGTDSGRHDDGRCVADGNEVMRFYSVGSTSGAIYDLSGLGVGLGEKNRTICTYSGSGRAHESGGGAGSRGRRAMVVCRVIAGRVCKRLGVESFKEGRAGFDSVSGDNGELFVFDARAVLPCFLIIYKL